MDARSALRYAAIYHALALAATLGGALVAGLGIAIGFRGALGAISLTDPASIVGAVGVTGVVVAAVGVVAGVYLRRVGQTAARIHVGARALDEGLNMPSTSVIARKVGREVSEEVSKYMQEDTGTGAGTSGFEFGDEEEAGSPRGEAESAALD